MATSPSASCICMICCARGWLEKLGGSRKPRRGLLQRQGEPVREIRDCPIEAAEQHDLKDLRLIIMRRQRLELGIAQGRAMMQRIHGRDQRPLRFRPAWRGGAIKHGGANLLGGEMCRAGKGRDMYAPFVFASVERRCGR